MAATDSSSPRLGRRRVGVAVVGLGGAVSTTAIAGLELARLGLAGTDGLPLADPAIPGADELVAYDRLVFGGWDVSEADLATAAEHHAVLDAAQLAAVAPALAAITPWPAVSDPAFCQNIDGVNRVADRGLRAKADRLRADLRGFVAGNRLDGCVVMNLASVERQVDLTAPALQTVSAFEAGLDADDPAIGPAMLYAYAALREGMAYGNFTPSVAADVPALLELSTDQGVPVAGKDGKTGQTMMKTVLAPAFRSRALRVDGWFSTNVLGNRDGLALDDPASLASKLETKAAVLDSILGYPVEDHVVAIHYYRPRGDDKEAWDTIDIVGFLGQRMQVKVNFLCKDSILAAPLVVEIARTLDLAARCGHGGVLEQLALFFKAPMTRDGTTPEHALHRQETALLDWLAAATPAVVA